MTLQALRGTTDVLGDDVKRWTSVEQIARRFARLYGYQEIRTPIIEDAALFLRSIGETSDIVQKEMFQFKDRGDHDIVLRPEGTAPVVRAYLEHHLHKTQGFAKLFYLGTMFRAERPQAGRYRQFHQCGAEAIGSESPWVDVEAIALCMDVLQGCGIADLRLWVSSMGSRADQQESAQRLRERLRPRLAELCKECQSRFEKNIFRVLDCKNPQCKAIAWEKKEAPFLLGEESRARFDAVRRGLQGLGIPFDDSQAFARGLDYYTHTVFEVRSPLLGAQDAVAAGGRYDRLIEDLGGPPTGAIGFAAGIERILLAQAKSGVAADTTRSGLWLAVPDAALIEPVCKLAHDLRLRGVETVMDLEGRSLKSQLREADKAGFKLVGIVGAQEIARKTVTLKDLQRGSQEEVAWSALVESLGKQAEQECRP